MAFLATCTVMCVLWFLVTELSKELAEQARTDPLTGALNRRAMEDSALRETTRSIRYGHLPCMIVLDIDEFKHLNDTRGHAAGDAALQALVNRSNPCCASTMCSPAPEAKSSPSCCPTPRPRPASWPRSA